MREVGQYMDVNSQPARKVSKESVVTLHFYNSSLFDRNSSLHTIILQILDVLSFLKMPLEKVTSPRGDVGSEPPSRRVGAIRADGFCSTDTSCDSSPVSSDLEVTWTTWIQSLKLRNESNLSLNKHFSPSL